MLFVPREKEREGREKMRKRERGREAAQSVLVLLKENIAKYDEQLMSYPAKAGQKKEKKRESFSELK